MFGFPIISMVCAGISIRTCIQTEPTFLTGRPLIPLDTMVIERAGEKWSIWQWIKFVAVTGIPNLPAFISNRPSVVDKRLDSVRQRYHRACA